MKIVDVLVDMNVNAVYNSRITSRVRLLATTTLAKLLNPYVPFDTGTLANTAEVSETSVTYIQPYARRMYYGEDFNFNTDYHPFATHHWLDALKDDKPKMKELTNTIQRGF